MYLSSYEIPRFVKDLGMQFKEITMLLYTIWQWTESAFLDYLFSVFQLLKVSESKTNRNMDLDLKNLRLSFGRKNRYMKQKILEDN